MVAVAIINSIIGGSTGGMCVLFFNKYILKQKWSYLMSLNGALTGIFNWHLLGMVRAVKEELELAEAGRSETQDLTHKRCIHLQ